MRKFMLIALAALVLASVHVSAGDLSDTESTMHKYYEAVKSSDSETVSQLMHPDALYRFRDTIHQALRGPKSELAATNFLPLFGVTSIEEFEAISDIEVFQILTEKVASSIPEWDTLLENASIETVGEIRREDIVYVTYIINVKMQGQEFAMEDVQKMKQHEGNWKLLLSSTSDAVIARIQAEFL